MKVLVIDDEEDVRHVAQLSLARIGGMTVLVAGSGEEGLAIARREIPDVILLDLMMPVMDGRETLHALRSSTETAAIPVMFLTASAVPGDVRRLAELGATAVILKPFDPLGLAAQVRKILGA